jgi:hypothetical protein
LASTMGVEPPICESDDPMTGIGLVDAAATTF